MLDRIFDNLQFHFSVEASIVLLLLIFLEAVLSADNAIALAAIAQGLDDKEKEKQALNYGLVIAYVLRITLLLTATWVQKYWQFELIGASYLLWLVFQHFTSEEDEENQHHGPKFSSVLRLIPVIALTDLAFSLDSVTTAIAVSQETWLVLTGTTIGVITLRFMAGLFIRWLDEFTHLEDAGYITVAFVGLRLLLKVINESLVPPQWIVISAIAVILMWGFSKRNDKNAVESVLTAPELKKQEVAE
ncbi:Integral membrane protein TerC [Rivularia sp. IAM M-261]|nr:Integral membrane protein TerC [Calothrix sp. PCC 7716]GJD16882.1 Integral membrane protein TerC [Rivularia sp. IAM M-261]